MPPHLQWGKSLDHLLQDQSGVDLFTKFLIEEVGSDAQLQFLFACKGLRNFNVNIDKLVPSIFKKFLQKDTLGKASATSPVGPKRSTSSGASGTASPTKSLLPPIHPKIRLTGETYSNIKEKIEAKQFLPNIFNDAQKEVEDKIAATTYPSFLKSELYLCYPNQQGSDSSPSSNPSIGHVGKYSAIFLDYNTNDCCYVIRQKNFGPILILYFFYKKIASGFLETVPEDLELPGHCATDAEMEAHHHLRLTQGALAATVHQRLAAEPRQPEATAGYVLFISCFYSIFIITVYVKHELLFTLCNEFYENSCKFRKVTKVDILFDLLCLWKDLICIIKN